MKRHCPLVAAGALAIAAWGCGDRTYLTETQGRAFRQAFARQAVNPTAGEKPRELKGLDSQEASIIARSYRRNLRGPTKDDDDRDRQPLLILTAPKAKGIDGMLPPPSVPQGDR